MTMRKFLSLMLLVLVAVGASAQSRKYWDFRTLSQETIDNLVADPATWTITNKEDGTFDRAADAKKISGELTANGMPIKELQGLTFGTAGLSNGNNFMIATNRFRMTRNNMEIIFPKLAPGQTVTVRGRSANSTATNRGFAGNDNLEYISGPIGGICIGNQAEGYGSADYPVEEDGNYTLVWKVREDLGTTDSVDVVIKMVTGGLDMAEIYIDNGNEDVIEESKKIAYLYDSSKANYALDSDPMYEIVYGSGSYEVEAIDIKDFTSDMTDTISALETNYDVVMVSEGPASGHKFASALKELVNRVPMMNMKSFFYKSGVWGWGAGENPKPATGTIVLSHYGASHKAFKSLGFSAGDEIELWVADGYEGNIIQGYSVSEGSFINADSVLATIGDGIKAIHEHGRSNIYMLFPFSSDAAIAYGEGSLAPGDDLPTLVTAVVDYLAASKSTVRQANKPSIEQTNGDGVTTVTISTNVADATIYYTTDGSEPTAASAVYTEPLTFTEPVVLKAYVSAVGYNDSDVASAEVLIKGQWDAPTISVTRNADNSVITLTAEEGANIYFNFVDGADSIFAQKYTEPIVLTWPATIAAFAAGGDNVDSELVKEYVSINSLTAETIRLDTLAHFDANPTDWFLNDTENGGTGEAKAYYFNGKSAWDYYSTEVDYTEEVKDETGVVVETVTHYKPDAAAARVYNPLNENGWVIKSAGQVLTLEGTLDTNAGVGNGATGRYAETAIDAIDGAPSKGAITFGKKMDGNPYTGTIETTAKYAGPFDVLVAVGNGNKSGKSEMEVQISADGATWTTLGSLNLADTQRYYKKTRLVYNETAEVYVRVAHVGGGTSAQVYDIFIYNNGEYSKEYTPEVIDQPTVAGAEVVGVQIYNLSGVQQNGLGKGLNIVRRVYSNGTVEVLKVMGK